LASLSREKKDVINLVFLLNLLEPEELVFLADLSDRILPCER
jgi:hypothetical protein